MHTIRRARGTVLLRGVCDRLMACSQPLLRRAARCYTAIRRFLGLDVRNVLQSAAWVIAPGGTCSCHVHTSIKLTVAGLPAFLRLLVSPSKRGANLAAHLNT